MKIISLTAVFLFLFSLAGFAQDEGKPSETPDAKSVGTIRQIREISRERREEAYAKLLEGQRYLWELARYNSDPSDQTQDHLKTKRENQAKAAFQKAVELNPRLAEGYTALAELALVTKDGNIEEAILLARIAVRLDKDNFGSHLYLARLYTIKSNIGRGKLNEDLIKGAIKQWETIARLDPRNAEALAFLSAFYEETKQPEKRLDALRKWGSAAEPIERGFYSRVLGRGEDISPENATPKLAQALLEAGKNQEALKILTQAVVDNSQNPLVIELLQNALENAPDDTLSPSIIGLKQAVYASPENEMLVVLLAQTIARTGEVEDAASVLKNAVVNSDKKNIAASSDLQVAIGDLYADSKQVKKAIAAYELALEIRGVKKNTLVGAANKEFALRVFGKMIQTLKRANRIEEAKLLIENSRPIFGKDSIDLSKEHINLLREAGNEEEALQAVKKSRKGAPGDISLLRSEAALLVKAGQVEEGIGLVRDLIENKPQNSATSMLYDDFSNYLFISSLHVDAKQKSGAIAALDNALSVADRIE